jgi:uncharacterized protein (UPF0332 family)
MKFDVSYLLRGGLLRKIPASEQKARESITASQSWIKESEDNFNNKSFKSCVLTSYLAMFHAGRAILFLDGFREKSHFAVARYLEDKYVNKGNLEEKWIKFLDYYRELRHDDQYRTSVLVTEEEAKDFLDFAKQFTERMEKLLEFIIRK